MKEDLEQKIISDIKSGKVKIKSRYRFLAEKLGLGSATVLTILLAILSISLVLVYLKSTENLCYLSFGWPGLGAFLESFPFLLVAACMLILGTAGFIIKKNDWSYKWPFRYIALVMVGVVIVSGTGIAMSRVEEKIEMSLGSIGEREWLRPFFPPRFNERHNGIAGVISEVGDNYILIETPHGGRFVDTSNTQLKVEYALTEGIFAVIIGESNDNMFVAKNILIKPTSTMPLIRRGIESRFRNLNPDWQMPIPHGFILPERKNCMFNCQAEAQQPLRCYQQCF